MKRIRGYKPAFTLIEILIAVAVIAVISVTVVILLRPAEHLRRLRDEQRISETNLLSKTVYLFESVDGGFLGVASTSYVSIPDPLATTALGSDCAGLGLPDLPAGWTYHCAGPDNYRKIDGTGWVPVNFTQLSSGRPFSRLPIDPENATSSGLYYTYTTDGGLDYEFTSALVSNKYAQGGTDDKVSSDGGKFAHIYEIGADLALAPIDHAGDGLTQSDYTFSGFEPPIQTTGVGVYHRGRTLPIKFSLTGLDGKPTTAATADLVVTKIQDGIVGTVPIDLSVSSNDSGNHFSIAGSKYSYNLDTGELGVGTWQLKAVLNDGSSYSVIISLDSN